MGHEEFSRVQEIERSSDRSFGFVFAVVFVLIGLWPLMHGREPRWWAFAIGAAFAAIAVALPRLLGPLNVLWTRFGLLLGRIVSPIALGVLFYLVIAPLGLFIRLAGKDPLRLKRDLEATSYWIAREPPGPPPASMTRQF